MSKTHGKKGNSKKSPKFRFNQKLEAEKNVVKNKSLIKNPVSTVRELFKR